MSQSDVHFLVMDILERKGLEFDRPRLGSFLDSLIIEKTNSQFFQQILRENEDFLNHMNRLKVFIPAPPALRFLEREFCLLVELFS